MARRPKSLRYADSHTPPPSRPNFAVATLFIVTGVGLLIVGSIAVFGGQSIVTSSADYTDLRQFSFASLFSTRWLPLALGTIILLAGLASLFAAIRLFYNSRWFSTSEQSPKQ